MPSPYVASALALLLTASAGGNAIETDPSSHITKRYSSSFLSRLSLPLDLKFSLPTIQVFQPSSYTRQHVGPPNGPQYQSFRGNWHYPNSTHHQLTANSSQAIIQGDCVNNDQALEWLASKLSSASAISCLGSPLQQYNMHRYWGEQYGKNASVVVFPGNTQDVSYAVQASSKSSFGYEFAFVSGAHGQTNASSATGFIIDLSWMNKTEILQSHDIDGENYTLVSYQGGAQWGQVLQTTNGTGYTAVGARVSNVGVGGFSTGGGIGFLAGAYGFASDRLRAVEVVLMSGQVVLATKSNQYSDLLWALQGGGGQFGIVTNFYQEAAPEPKDVTFGTYFVSPDSIPRARNNTVRWFNNNTDPFSLMYYATGFLPADLDKPTENLGMQTVLVALRFNDPTNSYQMSFQDTFAPLLSGVDIISSQLYQLPYASAFIFDEFFPYGFRRGFYGPQTSNISAEYLGKAADAFGKYIDEIVATGDAPITAAWVIQYMFPGLNGNLPIKDSGTAWPHATVGHQTLFSPAWNLASNDAVTNVDNTLLNKVTYDQQASVGPAIPDYPNYISPDATGSRVWGSNVKRLIEIKEKYDPDCRIHQGRVFASAACVRNGWANIHP